MPPTLTVSAHTVRILIIDDDALSAELTGECLMMDADISVQIASDGASALQAVPSFSPDVILLDVHLPDISGIELAAQLKVVSPNPDMRIIILSGSVHNVGMANCPEGVSAWLEKPVHIDTLLECVRRRPSA